MGTNKNQGFTAEEKAAVKERAKELKAAATREEEKQACLDAIAAMPQPDRNLAERCTRSSLPTRPCFRPKHGTVSPLTPRMIKWCAPSSLPPSLKVDTQHLSSKTLPILTKATYGRWVLP